MTLTQLLVSIAILAFPMGLYATELRGIPGRRPDMVLLIGSLGAHCVELEAFLWLALTPCIGALLARWRAPQLVPGRDDSVSTGACIYRTLLRFGPWYAVIAPLSGWAAGFRENLSILGVVYVLSEEMRLTCPECQAILETDNRST